MRKKGIILFIGMIAALLFVCGCKQESGSRYCYVRIEGDSMEPTFSDGNIVISDCRPESYERNDIVLVEKDGETMIKRLIALPGDHIVIEDGYVFVNGKETEDFGYTSGDINQYLYSNEYFVLGDNRIISKDSRSFGSLTIEEIQGKIIEKRYEGSNQETE